MNSKPKKKKTNSKVNLRKESSLMNTLGPTHSPSMAVAPALSPSSYRTPPDLPSTIEELLDQVPDCSEVPPPPLPSPPASPSPPPPQEEIIVVEEKKPFGWNLPPRPSNWHDQPPKKGEPYTVLFGRNPIYVYDEKEVQSPPPPPPPLECPFHHLPLPQYVSNQGWAYVKCPQQPCAVFLDEKKSPEILAQLQAQKHPQLIAGNGTAEDPNPPLMCFCHDPLALRVARTQKNPGRMFLACKTQRCKFFQRVNEPWSHRLWDSWAQANQTV